MIGIFYGIRDFSYVGPNNFLWIQNISEPDPLFILPVLSALTTFIQSKQSMPDTSSAQNKIMLYFMPIFIGYISFQFPAGLVLYWVVMMTSRAEYRLLLRQDNADLRLTEKGRAIGLVNDERYEAFTTKRSLLERTLDSLAKINIAPNEENQKKIADMGTVPLRSSTSLLELLRREEISYIKLAEAFSLPSLPQVVAEQVEVQTKYEGYIAKQYLEVARALKLEGKLIPKDIDYIAIKELSAESAEKLQKVRPTSIGQAARISGVSPADIGVLMVYLEMNRRKEREI